MVSEARRYYAVEEYLAVEEASPIRHEYVGGFLYAMVGSTASHNVIVTNVSALLRAAIRGGPCRTYSQGMRVRAASDLYYYPDVVVACGIFDPATRDLTDADIIVEVLSPSTATIDRREKLREYLRLASLSAYLIVWQDQRRVEYHYRENGDWKQIDLVHDGTIHLTRSSLDLTLDAIYEDIPFPGE